VIGNTLRGLIQILGGLSVGFLLVFAYAAWLLSSGPISLAFLNEYIAKSLSPRDGAFSVELSDTILTWAGWDRNLDVRVIGVGIAGHDGKILATVPELSLSVSAQALLERRLAPRTIELFGPKLHLVRLADGSIEFGFGEVDAEKLVKAGDPLAFATEFFEGLEKKPDPNRPLSYLRRVSINDASVEVRDLKTGSTWSAPGSEIFLSRSKDGLSGEVELNIKIGENQFSVTLVGDYKINSHRLDFGIDFDGVNPSMLTSLFENVEPLKIFNIPIQGTVAGSVGLDWNVDTLTFDLSGKEGVLQLKKPIAQTLKTESVEIAGLVDTERNEVTLSRFDLNFKPGTKFEAPAPIDHTWRLNRLSGKARFGKGVTGHLALDKVTADMVGPSATFSLRVDGIGGDMNVEGQGVLKGVPVSKIGETWPEALGTDAWTWVTNNLSNGEITEASAHFTASVPVEGKAKVGKLGGRLAFENVSVNYLSPMPIIHGVDGIADFDPTKFDIKTTGGKANGMEVGRGRVLLTGLNEFDQYADITVDVNGPLKNALEIVDSKPLGYAAALGLKPSRAKGESATRLSLKFIMEHALTLEKIEVKAKSSLRKVRVSDAVLGLDLSNGKLELDVDKKGMKIGGVTNLGSIPVTLRWEEFFEEGAPTKTKYAIQGSVSDKQLVDEIGLNFPPFTGGYLAGVTAASVVVTKDQKDRSDISVFMDLENANLALPLFNWRKPIGETGEARVRLDVAKGKVQKIREFFVDAAGLTAKGAIKLNDASTGLEEVQIKRLIHGRTDIQGTVVPFASGWDINIDGPSLDIKAVRENLFEAKAKNTEDDGGNLPPITLSFSIGKVWLGGERRINQATGAFSYDGSLWHSAILDGRIGDNKTVRLIIEPKDKTRSLLVTSDDAGESLRTLDLFDSMIGGKLVLTGVFDDQVAGSPLVGNLAVEDFRVVDAPAIAHVLSIMALTGIVEALGGEGIAFNSLKAPFINHQGILELKDAKASGLSIGLTASGKVYTDAEFIDVKGTVIPAYVFNSLLGNIPLLGRVFTGGEEGGGIFAANYSVSGPLNKPKAEVNPLSALAPSFLRNIFRGGDVLPPGEATEFTLPNLEKEGQ